MPDPIQQVTHEPREDEMTYAEWLIASQDKTKYDGAKFEAEAHKGEQIGYVIEGLLIAIRGRDKEIDRLNATTSELRADQEDWRSGVGLIASALRGRDPRTLCCVTIAEAVLSLKADEEALRTALSDIAYYCDDSEQTPELATIHAMATKAATDA